jgi:signal transduction histidine kinase
MTYRTRLLLVLLMAVLLPMIGLALFVRHEMTDRLTAQYERRVASLVTVIEEDLILESESIAASLVALQRTIVDDNRFRLAAVDRESRERHYLLDYAENAMQLTGLSMLQIQDGEGRIISSGHFRNEYDRLEPGLPKLLATIPGGTAFVQARAPDAPFLALASVDSFQMGGKQFYIIAGVRVEHRFLNRLARDGELAVSLYYPGGTLTSGSDDSEQDPGKIAYNGEITGIVRELIVPFIDPAMGKQAVAKIRVSHRLEGLAVLRSSFDRWFLVAVTATVLLSILFANWLASRFSRPLVELADKTSNLDLDRLDIDFKTHRKDEIGALSRLMGRMTERLRASAVRIKDAERRATLGELARQVNHDIKNGLIPIHNVFQHLIQLARNDPEKLPEVFDERRDTINSSILYLENLASNYARLSPDKENKPCNVNAIIQQVVEDMRGSSESDLRTNLGDNAVVRGDPVALRRILENLVNNAIQSLESGSGFVNVSTIPISVGSEKPGVRITVEDTGKGMSEEQCTKAFDDFYTTKEDGTGLGLSIVRRLVMDIDGSIHLESEPGRGSRFIIDLPGEREPSIDPEATGNGC